MIQIYDHPKSLPYHSFLKKDMNHLKKFREKVLLSKAELARKAGVSTLTIDRVEKGKSCRLETKRKIILALGLKLSQREKIFED
jgi:DNA-binding XRE family transcriptional regulator